MTGKELFDLEDALLKGPQERRVQVARKTDPYNGGNARVIQKRYIIVYGTDDTGYMAAHEDYIGALEEFLAVRFTTPIYDNAQSAYDDALASALEEAENDGFTITV